MVSPAALAHRAEGHRVAVLAALPRVHPDEVGARTHALAHALRGAQRVRPLEDRAAAGDERQVEIGAAAAADRDRDQRVLRQVEGVPILVGGAALELGVRGRHDAGVVHRVGPGVVSSSASSAQTATVQDPLFGRHWCVATPSTDWSSVIEQ